MKKIRTRIFQKLEKLWIIDNLRLKLWFCQIALRKYCMVEATKEEIKTGLVKKNKEKIYSDVWFCCEEWCSCWDEKYVKDSIKKWKFTKTLNLWEKTEFNKSKKYMFWYGSCKTD